MNLNELTAMKKLERFQDGTRFIDRAVWGKAKPPAERPTYSCAQRNTETATPCFAYFFCLQKEAEIQLAAILAESAGGVYFFSK